MFFWTFHSSNNPEKYVSQLFYIAILIHNIAGFTVFLIK